MSLFHKIIKDNSKIGQGWALKLSKYTVSNSTLKSS